MNTKEIMDLAIDQANVDINDYPYTRVIKYLNLVKDDFFSYLITGVNENWNWDIWKTNSVLNQSEYRLPEAASDTEGNLKISGVSINYKGDTYNDGSFKYKKARLVNLGNLKNNWNFYTNNQSIEDPIYYIADKSIFIAPHPKSGEFGFDRIELKGIKSIKNYDENTLEQDIKIPLYLHNVLVQGILQYIHKGEGRKTEANNEIVEYERKRDEAVKKFSSRNEGPFFISYPE